MKECVRCELLSECRAINWQGGEAGATGTVDRRPLRDPAGDSPAGDSAAGNRG
jgi:hypothetical protein